MVGAGIGAALGKHATLFAEGGQSFGLRGKPSFADLRAGLTYYTSSALRARAHTLGVSLVHYSRFSGNAIGYANLEHDVPLRGSSFRVCGRNLASTRIANI